MVETVLKEAKGLPAKKETTSQRYLLLNTIGRSALLELSIRKNKKNKKKANKINKRRSSSNAVRCPIKKQSRTWANGSKKGQFLRAR